MEDEKSKKEVKTAADEAPGKIVSFNFDALKAFLESMGVTRVLIWGLVMGLIIGGVGAGYYVRSSNSVSQVPAVSKSTESSLTTSTSVSSLPIEDVKEKVNSYILSNMVSPDTSVIINSVEEDKGLYKLDITLSMRGQTQNVQSYATKDGVLFFPSSIDISVPPQTFAPPTTPSVQSQTTPSATLAPASSLATADDPSIGPENAPITIVEFSDFQCPYCASASATVHQILDAYGDQVRVVYRDFPLSSIHPHAQKAAEAGECANDQGMFWELHDVIFANQGSMGVDDLKKYAADLGMDSASFDNCLDNGMYEDEVKQDISDGLAAGVSSTPTFFVNGEKVVGAKPFAVFKEDIDAILNAPTTSLTSGETASGSVLPAYALSSATTEQAYNVALELPDVLEKVPCYCSCGSVGHDSLKECFLSEGGGFDEHASFCDICVSEALDVKNWYNEGISVQEIRTRIDEKYSQYGEATNTPPI